MTCDILCFELILISVLRVGKTHSVNEEIRCDPEFGYLGHGHHAASGCFDLRPAAKRRADSALFASYRALASPGNRRWPDRIERCHGGSHMPKSQKPLCTMSALTNIWPNNLFDVPARKRTATS